MNQYEPRADSDPRLTRKAAAEAASLSERQRKTAIAIAGIGADEFESAIEADVPGPEHRRNLDPGPVAGHARDFAPRGDSMVTQKKTA